jgi:hypothetical protein
MGFPDRIERTVELAYPRGWAKELAELAGYLDAA